MAGLFKVNQRRTSSIELSIFIGCRPFSKTHLLWWRCSFPHTASECSHFSFLSLHHFSFSIHNTPYFLSFMSSTMTATAGTAAPSPSSSTQNEKRPVQRKKKAARACIHCQKVHPFILLHINMDSLLTLVLLLNR